MSASENGSHSGGCQCGAVRFRVRGALGRASVCHCRMCQKAVGGFFAPLVNLRRDQLTWTRGERAIYHSSNHVSRGFCAACGTPLSYEEPGEMMALSIGAFDRPQDIAPTVQYGIEAKLGFVDDLAGLPARTTLDDLAEAPFLSDIHSNQHPDHDTQSWPPADRPTD
ncbi:GFA family protein [Stappia sp.]|uniref:GFA family protein n=1 Tax=Stappia sp. TaxID=1870903 RepID=UPI003A996696